MLTRFFKRRPADAPRGPKFAVLFKIHFWDDYAARQFARLKQQTLGGDLFIVLDETNGKIEGIDHDKILRVTVPMAQAEGYLPHPPGQEFWYNNDYPLHMFLDRLPDYQFVAMCEYDACVQCDIANIIGRMAHENIGFVGHVIQEKLQGWYWASTVQPYYAEELPISPRLLCFSVYSAEFARILQRTRRAHTQSALQGGFRPTGDGTIIWPFGEAFIAAEIATHSIATAPLADFGDVSLYDWAPACLEREVQHLPAPAFAHPVLSDARFLEWLKRVDFMLREALIPGTKLAQRLDMLNPAAVVQSLLGPVLQNNNWDLLPHLRAYAQRHLGEEADALFNIAQDKPATQSSVCAFSRHPHIAQDATNAVRGVPDGQYSFHTAEENKPWWCLDLNGIFPVREITIFNRMDVAYRAQTLQVATSLNLLAWQLIHNNAGQALFGGVDGSPLRVRFETPHMMRFLHLSLAETEALHLDHVRVLV